MRFLLKNALGPLAAGMLPVGMTACANPGARDAGAPKSWHQPPQQTELWGVKEISFDRYKEIKPGTSVSRVDKAAPREGILGFICWIGGKSYQACFRIESGLVTDKSLREVRLVYKSSS